MTRIYSAADKTGTRQLNARLLCLSCAVAALSFGASARADVLTPFQATYTWLWHGAAVAASTLTLEQRQGETWVYSSHSEPRGIGVLYPMRPKLESVMRVTDQGVQPLS
jgi:hypothetical protein